MSFRVGDLVMLTDLIDGDAPAGPRLWLGVDAAGRERIMIVRGGRLLWSLAQERYTLLSSIIDARNDV